MTEFFVDFAPEPGRVGRLTADGHGEVIDAATDYWYPHSASSPELVIDDFERNWTPVSAERARRVLADLGLTASADV